MSTSFPLPMAAVVPHWEELIQDSMSTSFPTDIMIDILLRLPVKSLIRFKCVCKPWCNLFGSAGFKKMHLHQAITKNNGCLLVKHLSGSGHETFSLQSHKTFDEVGRLEVPVSSMTQDYQIVECSHGLICLTESDLEGSYLSLNTFLWNPAIREFRVLPRNHINSFTGPIAVVALGFAFHAENNDYKVVRIVYFFKTKTHEVEVYSISTDSWEKINVHIRGHICSPLSQAFVNGALHWMASGKDEKNNDQDNDQDFILTFDLGANEVNEMILENFGYDESEVEKSLAMFRGSLSVFIYKPFQLNENFEMWVMKEYGVVASWTKQYSFRLDVEFMIPLGFFDDSELIMENGDTELVLSDINVKQVKHLQVFGPARVVKYTESLVFPKSENRYVWNLELYERSLRPLLQPSSSMGLQSKEMFEMEMAKE